MSYFLQIPVLICFMLIACDRSTPNAPSSDTPTITMASDADKHDTTKTPDYPGTYTGVLYCSDCEGISTKLSLSYDNNFTLTTSKLGKKETKEETKTGFFSYQKTESIITLIGVQAPNRYLAEENVLYLLDLEGKRVTGDLADKYILHKK